MWFILGCLSEKGRKGTEEIEDKKNERKRGGWEEKANDSVETEEILTCPYFFSGERMCKSNS